MLFNTSIQVSMNKECLLIVLLTNAAHKSHYMSRCAPDFAVFFHATDYNLEFVFSLAINQSNFNSRSLGQGRTECNLKDFHPSELDSTFH